MSAPTRQQIAREHAAVLYGRILAHLDDLQAGHIDGVLYSTRVQGVHAAARAQGPEVQAALGKLLEGDAPGPRSLIG